MNILYLTRQSPPPERVWTAAFRDALARSGFAVRHLAAETLPPASLLARLRETEVLLTSWGSPRLPEALATDPGTLRYICHINGAVRDYIPAAFWDSPVVVTNWGSSTGPAVAEGALALLLACLKNLRPQIEDKLSGRWVCEEAGTIGSLQGLKLGFYGFGHIARAFHRIVRELGPDIRVFDPCATELPHDCRRADSLRGLFADSEAVMIFAALTEETRGSVGKSLLALLPDHAILVNTARGDIINQDDLFAELAAGRLRAGLDVLAGEDWLALDHPAIRFKNLILTSHRVGDSYWQTPISSEDKQLAFFHKTCLENLARFLDGQPLDHLIGKAQYSRMT